MRVGVCLLPELPWPNDVGRWQDAERAGFATAWTYDHLSWRTLRDGPWYAAIPLLTAAAAATGAIRLGTLVTSPNFRHPVPFAKEVMTLDTISNGRLDVGLGAGTPAHDAQVLGEAALTAAQRIGRLNDFVTLLDALLRQPATTMTTPSYTAVDARMQPGCVQQPRVPFTIAATARRGLDLAARYAATWVTFGPAGGGADESAWWSAVEAQSRLLDAACEATGRSPETISRMALVPLDLPWPQRSPTSWDRFVNRLTDTGFTDVVVHWPRPQDPALPGPPRETFDHIRATL